MKSHPDRFAVATRSLKGTLAVLCIAFVAQACAPTETPHAGSGGAPGSGSGGASTTGSGGASTTGSGGASTTGSGGASTTGSGGASTTGSGGASTTGSGGASTTGSGGASTTGSGGASTTGSGGASTTGSGGASTTGSGGATGTGSGGSSGTVAACTTEAKGGTCTMSGQTCNKTCGPDKKGAKSETCNGATYDEGECTFPAGDYACYKVTSATAACPAGTQASQACTAGTCMPCSGYVDSNMNPKTGYCVCGSNMKWVCGSDKEWPCLPAGGPKNPGGTGC